MQKGIVRLTLDVPVKSHAFLKMAAANEGVSMKQFILKAVEEKMCSDEKHVSYIEHSEFKKCLSEVFDLCDASLRRLADQ